MLVNAISPERRLGGDELSAVASITHVYVSNDLQVMHRLLHAAKSKLLPWLVTWPGLWGPHKVITADAETHTHTCSHTHTHTCAHTHTHAHTHAQVVKVYVSVYSDERGKKRCMDNLQRLES